MDENSKEIQNVFEMEDGDVVHIGNIKVHYLGLHNVFHQPRIGITAPSDVTILREELKTKSRHKYDHVIDLNYGDFLSIGDSVKLVTRDDPYIKGSVKIGVEAPRNMRIQRVNNKHRRKPRNNDMYRDDFARMPTIED